MTHKRTLENIFLATENCVELIYFHYEICEVSLYQSADLKEGFSYIISELL